MERVRADDLVCREVGEDLIVLDLKTSRYLRVNPSARVLWPALQEGTERGTLVRLLMDRFELDEGRAGSDVDRFLASLRTADLLDEA